MSQETDAILALYRASGINGKVTSVTSVAKGRVSGTYHGRIATPSLSDRQGVGLAVDLDDHIGGRAYSSVAMAIWRFFSAVNDSRVRSGKKGLAELIYSYAPTFIKNGRHYPTRHLNKSTYDLHLTHCHVAVDKGTFLSLEDAGLFRPVVVVPPVAPAPTQSEEDDMQRPVSQIEWPTGGHTQVFSNGEVKPHGPLGQPLPFFGDPTNLPADRRRNFEYAIDIVAIDINDPQRGYSVIAQNNDYYNFDAGEYANIVKFSQTGKWPTP